MSHTPGPWDIYGSDVVQGPLEWDEDGCLIGDKPVSIAKVWKYPPKAGHKKGVYNKAEREQIRKGILAGNKAQDGNLALIAAAPDMYEVLEQIEKVIQLGNATYDSEDALMEWFEAQEGLAEKCEKALKKARWEE